MKIVINHRQNFSKATLYWYFLPIGRIKTGKQDYTFTRKLAKWVSKYKLQKENIIYE